LEEAPFAFTLTPPDEPMICKDPLIDDKDTPFPPLIVAILPPIILSDDPEPFAVRLTPPFDDTDTAPLEELNDRAPFKDEAMTSPFIELTVIPPLAELTVTPLTPTREALPPAAFSTV